MKETSREARPNQDIRETQTNEIIQCVANYGPLSRKQISELTNIGYTSVCPRVLENLGTIFKIARTQVIKGRRYELVELINRKYRVIKEVNKRMNSYEGKTTNCDKCDTLVRAKDNGKPQWRQVGDKWRLVDLDGEIHDCQTSKEKRNAQLRREDKSRGTGVPREEINDYVELETRAMKEAQGDIFQTAIDKFQFDRTFRIIELSASVSRKVSNSTISQIPQFETLEFWTSFKVQVESTTDIQQVFSFIFAEGIQSIEKQIEDARLRLSGL